MPQMAYLPRRNFGVAASVSLCKVMPLSPSIRYL
jgi:hypothetical protein